MNNASQTLVVPLMVGWACAAFAGCGRWLSDPLIEWGNYCCAVQVRDALIQLRFYEKGNSRKMIADVDTRASIYSRYRMTVLSDEYLFFRSSDIGGSMFVFDDNGTLCRFPAICNGKANQTYSFYKEEECNFSGTYHEVTVLCLDKAERIRKYVLRGRFRVDSPDFDIDGSGELTCNGRPVRDVSEIKVLSVDDKPLKAPPVYYENGSLVKEGR